MKKGKRKIGFIMGCIALSILLSVSGCISLVIIGVVADENKKGTLKHGRFDTDNTQTENIADNSGLNNIFVPESNYDNFNDSGFVDNGNQIISGQNTDSQNTGNQNTNNQQVTDTPNTSQQNTDSQNTDNQSPGTADKDNGNVPQQENTKPDATQPKNDLLDTNKTKADIVDIYARVMNKAKADKPGFTKIEYQELPGGEEYRVIAEGGDKVTEEDVNKLMGFVEGLDVFVPKEEAEKEPYIHEKGDEDMSLFPVFSREKGSYLTDPEGIDEYTYTVLPDGNVKMTFVLVSEENPEPIAENSDVAPSYTGAVFAPMSKERIDGTVYHPIVTIFAKDIEYSLKYHDCSVELVFNPDTLQVVGVNQYANVSIKGSGNVVGIGFIGLERQELLSTVIIKDFKY